jgi:hypothetical protein
MATVADKWILVSSPSPDGEPVVAASGSRGLVAFKNGGDRVGGARGRWQRLPERAGRGRRCRPTVARDGDDGVRGGATSASGGVRVGGGRRLSGPAGDGDEGAEGRPAQAAALGAKAAAATAWNKKSSQSRSELCGTWGERSSALV